MRICKRRSFALMLPMALVPGCNTNADSREDWLFEKLSGGGITGTRLTLYPDRVEFIFINSFSGKITHRNINKLSKEQVDQAMESLIAIGIESWKTDYGRLSDDENRPFIDSTIEILPTTSWSCKLRRSIDSMEFRSKGYGVFPSDDDPQIPTGPKESGRYHEINRILFPLLKGGGP